MKEQMGFHPRMPSQAVDVMASKKKAAVPAVPSTNAAERPASETGNCRCIDDMPLAMAYVPMQRWQNIYDEAVGFERGTIFQDLDLPFIGEELPK